MAAEGKHRSKAISTLIRERLDKAFSDLAGLNKGLESAEPKKVDVVVAFSGGCDSMSLLNAVAKLKNPFKGRVIAVHVHHNLSNNADDWAKFCRSKAELLGVEFVLRKVKFSSKGEGVEAAARKARYRALNEVAIKNGCKAILTAHHLDDQIETFLIQWLRGAGPEGLAGMPYFKQDQEVAVVRPFLSFERKQLESYAKTSRLSYVQDESNEDTHFLRNVIRLEVVPKLAEIRKGFKKAAERSIDLIGESVEILREITEQDLAELSPEIETLSLSKFFKLSHARQARVFRLWLHENGFTPLPRARLLELIRQIKESKAESFSFHQEGGRKIWKHGAKLNIYASSIKKDSVERTFMWTGQDSVLLPEFDGELCFIKSQTGFSQTYLQSKPLTVRARLGGEKIKSHPFRPSKGLKKLFQEKGIPEAERGNMPLVWRDKTLIYVAGIGEEVREKLDEDEGERFSLVFRKNPTLL